MTNLFSFQGIAIMGNISLQYVNSNICTLRLGLDLKGELVVVGLLVCITSWEITCTHEIP